MSWLDTIGLGVIFPVIVASIFYILTSRDKKVENLHSRIIKRLLSFCLGKNEPRVFQTIMSLSLKESLQEIDHILTEGKSSQDQLRIDVAYERMNDRRRSILNNLKTEASKLENNKIVVWTIMIAVIILYIIHRIVLIE